MYKVYYLIITQIYRPFIHVYIRRAYQFSAGLNTDTDTSKGSESYNSQNSANYESLKFSGDSHDYSQISKLCETPQSPTYINTPQTSSTYESYTTLSDSHVYEVLNLENRAQR